MYNPVEYYYSNDYNISQIAKPEITRINTSYSPRKLIMGYWKKDYKSFIKQRTMNLESKEIQPHSAKQKGIKQSFTRLAESILNVSNCFENIPNRQTKTDRFVQKQKNKFTTPSPQHSKLHNHETHKIPGRLYKGTLLKNFDNSSNQIGESYILDPKKEFGYSQMSPKSTKKKEHSSEQLRQKHKQISNTEQVVTPYKDLKQQLMIRRSTLNNTNSTNSFKKTTYNIIDEKLEGMKFECLLIRPSPNNVSNLVMIQFENVLGYDESSFFGLQPDFIGSKQHEEYLVLRDHYFQKATPNSSFYIHKNIKELFNSICRVYQVGLYTLNYSQLLKDLINEKKLKVNGAFSILDYKIDTFVVDITNVLTNLKIKNPQLLIFIQPFKLLNKQESFIPNHTKMPYYDYYGQRFFIPFTQSIHPNQYRLLALPSLAMQSLLKNEEYSNGFVQINYFIEQFTLALQSEGNFAQFLNKSQNRITCINQSSYFRQIKQRLLQQIYFIDTLKLNQDKYDNIRFKKKENFDRYSSKNDYAKQMEILYNDIIGRNKEILEKFRACNYDHTNNLSQLHQELQQSLIRLNYCEMFVDSCYYLPY
ncbi:unnamed protein product (macronuclear) [Paramecium tetraurelia]|uniref:FCP1 homology domain-containing protein n=1 Tax=Paramecium tetraurelia TaxID=5888 RepID=A0EIB3_PARTE|nr:uncharacterized protein GSPATT00027383001 [Paramecium tetraurelia]CAK95054.1 unnamed protein product [Paramecium tetraurelia]|eukprot:XP_001462427.1 hypothetical protein (macronuclear) [Paramecium tetraurelia strain d4-2]